MFLSDLFQNEEQFLNVLFMTGSFVFGFVTKHYADAYIAGKKKLSQVRKVSDFVSQKIAEIDDALADDQIDNEEYARIFSIKKAEIEKAKEVIQK